MKKTFTLVILASLATLQLAYTSTNVDKSAARTKNVSNNSKVELNVQEKLLTTGEVTKDGDDVINASNDTKLLQGNRN